MSIRSLNEYRLDVYRRKATDLGGEGLLSLPDLREVNVARPAAAAQSCGGRHTIPTLATRLSAAPTSEAQQVDFTVRTQARATAEVGCANHKPGARVCFSSHCVCVLAITSYWVYLNVVGFF